MSKYNDEQNGNPYCINQLENKLLNEEPKMQNETLISRNMYHANQYNLQIKPIFFSSFSSKNIQFKNSNQFK